MTIVLYDIPSSTPNYGASPMTWRIRYCLGIKGIPFKTEWVEYPDIKPLYLKLGITPTARKSDGSGPHFTLPVIYDPSTNKYIPDSFAIAEYLDKQYPAYPETRTSLFPHDTIGLQLAFTDGLWDNIRPIMMLMTWNIFTSLNPASVGYYRNVREAGLGRKMEELVPEGSEADQTNKVKQVFAKFETYYANSNGGSGPFMMGEIPSWADVVVAGLLAILRLGWGENSDEWKDAIGYPNGRWAEFMERMRRYEC